MANSVVPTKANLLAIKKSLELSRVGYELLSRKRNILIHEMMQLIEHAEKVQSVIDGAYTEAYEALQMANITQGVSRELAETVPVDNGLKISYKSVMGVELPIVKLEQNDVYYSKVPYGMMKSSETLDNAYRHFLIVKKYTAELAQVENSVYRLAVSIQKTQKRANALKNIVIPRFTANIKFITESLEEKEREEFSRMKVIKTQKQGKEIS
jgi:H(+)-transporting ATP synthase, vacuolar type, subunit D